MLTLGIDTTARNLSVALAADGVLLAETLVTPQAKHSTLLLPMIDELLGRTGFSIARVDRFTAAHGPGSFSGVRVGVSTAKGLAEAAGKPCAGVSTLAAMARNAVLFSGLICCVMDARRGETYSAIFACENQKLRRLTPDMACSADDLLVMLQEKANRIGASVLFLGDGAMCRDHAAWQESWRLAPAHICAQRASGVIFAAREEDYKPAANLGVQYLRLSQAERERKW